MTMLKRITATLKGSIEQVVDQIENQDAVVVAAIGEMKQTTAKARARLNRVRRDREGMERKMVELKQSENQWEQRAKDCAESDQDTALACLSRRNQCRSKRETLKVAMEQHIEAESKLELEVQRAEQRIEEMARQRNLMRSRQSAAHAVKTTQEWNAQGPIDVEAVFERWETRIIEAEMVGDSIDIDPLEHRFHQQESQAELQAELQALMTEKEKGHE